MNREAFQTALQLIFEPSQDETSEEFIGEWAEKRGIRDQLVIATKASPYPDIPHIPP
jgi:aryl-alcohol dehydrogenase-like predicted oxidoreductase